MYVRKMENARPHDDIDTSVFMDLPLDSYFGFFFLKKIRKKTSRKNPHKIIFATNFYYQKINSPRFLY